MKAIILAAGQGTRLKKYTENLPKGMLSFDGKTIIERQIEMYRKCGIDNIIIVRGFAADKIKYDGITYYDNKDYASTNMVASFLCASDEFDEDVLVSYSDVLFCENMLRTMIKAEGEFVCAVDTNWQSYWMKRYGKVDFDTESMKIGEGENITSLGLSDPPIEEIDARYVGLLKFSRTGLRKIVSIWERDYEKYKDRGWQQSGKKIPQAYMTDLLNAMIEEGNHVRAEKFENGWIEFDTNEDYENACEWVEDGSIKELLL